MRFDMNAGSRAEFGIPVMASCTLVYGTGITAFSLTIFVRSKIATFNKDVPL